MLREAFNDARRDWWLKRAEDFEAAKPVPGEYQGRASRAEQRTRWEWCHQTAQACRNKAALVPLSPDEFQVEIDAILDEGAT